eukprot:gene5374-10742_t
MKCEAAVELSRWWRRRCREESITTAFQSNNDANVLGRLGPNSLITVLSKNESAICFLHEEELQLRKEIEKLKASRHLDLYLAHLSYIHGTFLVLLMQYSDAYKAFQFAISLAEECHQKLSLEHPLGSYNSCLHRIKLNLLMESKRNEFLVSGQNDNNIAKDPIKSVINSVDKHAYGSITHDQFISLYASQSRPVVFTDATSHMLPDITWDFNYISNTIGQCTVPLRRAMSQSVEWAQQESAGNMKLIDFISSIESGTAGDKYLVDWSLSQHAPAILSHLHIPRYFSSDLLQLSPAGSIYRSSWPSLFIGPKGTQSKLHVDSFGSHFWMLLLSGRKKWVFYPKDETCLLYPSYDHSFDPHFRYDPLSNRSNTNHNITVQNKAESATATHTALATDHHPSDVTCPLSKYSHPYEVILNPGELLFVPAGSPHCVLNLDDTLAISGNDIDETNLEYAISQLSLSGLLCPRSKDLADCLSKITKSDISFVQETMNEELVTWDDFKHRPRRRRSQKPLVTNSADEESQAQCTENHLPSSSPSNIISHGTNEIEDQCSLVNDFLSDMAETEDDEDDIVNEHTLLNSRPVKRPRI